MSARPIDIETQLPKVVRETPLTPDHFAHRHIGPTEKEQQVMLDALGQSNLDQFVEQIVPQSIFDDRALDLGQGLTEQEALQELKQIATKNKVMTNMIGAGYYNTHTPGVVLRNVFENPAWYTAYTPYQPEISQGRLEALLNYQTMICDLTGMEIANASLLDEATAAAESMSLCKRMSKSRSNKFLVDQQTLPQTIDVLRTRAKHADIEIVIIDPNNIDQDDYFGLLLQYPGADGNISLHQTAIANAHEQKALVVMAADILALVLLRSPGELGADIAIGSSQRFGVPLGGGGPHAAYMSTRDKFKRSLPGRMVGVSIDSSGNQAYRLALQTREQHIRREKATSNICTAQALLAIMASFYAVYHGASGLETIARRVHQKTCLLAAGLQQLGYDPNNDRYFDTLTITTADKTDQILQDAEFLGVNLRRVNDQQVGISVDETTTDNHLYKVLQAFKADQKVDLEQLSSTTSITHEFLRTDEILTHPVFNRYHSETNMLRYIKQLADKDIALDRSMIPLGSCTMKLNASSEMFPVSWPEFSSIHPFAPKNQTLGYQQLVDELSDMLCVVTGYDAISLQPNAGSQGEYAGLLAIKAYHESRGDMQRTVCLIPHSAHGTNPASAQMCGMQVVVVKCDELGNVDLTDLHEKCALHKDELAAIMITYPSTHGVFEEQVREVCATVHQQGGQVYIDGANLNAMVGLCYPGEFGGDVSHLNLHKTFCIPHGGGGPGVGPVAVGEHLKPFLPGHSWLPGEHSVGAVAAAAWGSASILPISWMYMKMMGREGLKKASQIAILNANYVATQLADHYPVLYTGVSGQVAHECIIDLREIKNTSGIEAEDVAKRLIDYGFHAPTMSFPVPGTLMIEPTESESLVELDRFCSAMIKIRQEIAEIENGNTTLDESVLKHAPHTASDLCAEQWAHPYTRETAVFPEVSLKTNKYWPPVGRIDNAYGDRNLVCSCPSIDDYT